MTAFSFCMYAEQRAIRILQMEANGVLVHDLDSLDLVEGRDLAARRLGIEDAVDSVGHVVGGEVFAIVEHSVVDKMELPGFRVKLAPRLRELGFEIPLRVHLHQVVEDVVVDLDGGVSECGSGVKLVRLPGQRDIERAARAGDRKRIKLPRAVLSRGERPGCRSTEGDKCRRRRQRARTRAD